MCKDQRQMHKKYMDRQSRGCMVSRTEIASCINLYNYTAKVPAQQKDPRLARQMKCRALSIHCITLELLYYFNFVYTIYY